MRANAVDRGYDRVWGVIRGDWLKAHPRCVGCGHHASMVDHRQPLRDGGTNDSSNLQSMCRVCHGLKTRGDMRRRKGFKRVPQEVICVSDGG